jgi:hypothetical protein
MIRGITLSVLGGTLAATVQSSAAAERAFSLPPRHTEKQIPTIKAGLVDARVPRLGPVLLIRRGPVATLSENARTRFAGGMIDIFPLSPSGFHLGVGSRYFSRANFWVAAETATDGLIADTHLPRGIGSLASRRTFNRYTPATTVGYDLTLLPGLVAGVEGGTLLGRAIPRGPQVLRFRDGGAGPGDRANALNPIATMSLRFGF